jgi:DNA-binding transcriptional MerR regulator
MRRDDQRQSDLFPWEQHEPGQRPDEPTSDGDTDAGPGAVAADATPGAAPDTADASSTDGGAQAADGGEPRGEHDRDDEEDPAVSAMAGLIERLEREVGLIAAPGRDKPAIAAKEYYSISEVCDLVDLKPHVLRYWETQFQPLNPSKNRSGNRVYQRKEIKLILLVKHLLYEEKYTIEGAKAKLDRLRRGGGVRDHTSFSLDSDMMGMLRADLDDLLRILTPSEPT